MSDYSIVRVAKTGEAYDHALFDQVMALRDRTYPIPEELEPVEAIKQRLAGTNLANDPVDLEIYAIRDKAGAVQGFTVVEKYLDETGSPTASCMTYANADPAFARSPQGMEALQALHAASVDKTGDVPAITEVNVGDPEILNAAISQHHHPLSLANNAHPLVVEMAIKLGVDPATIPQKLITQMRMQAEGVKVPDTMLPEMLKACVLKDLHGNVTSALAPLHYNGLHLGDEMDPTKPFEGGPSNLHLAMINAPGGHDFKAMDTCYTALQKSILAGNNPHDAITVANAHETLEKQDIYNDMRAGFAKLQALHEQGAARSARVGERGGELLR